MAKAIVGGGATLAHGLDSGAPEIDNIDELTGAEALAKLRETVGHLFPLLQSPHTS